MYLPHLFLCSFAFGLIDKEPQNPTLAEMLAYEKSKPSLALHEATKQQLTSISLIQKVSGEPSLSSSGYNTSDNDKIALVEAEPVPTLSESNVSEPILQPKTKKELRSLFNKLYSGAGKNKLNANRLENKPTATKFMLHSKM